MLLHWEQVLNHVPYLEPLYNHLKECIPEVGKNIFVKAYYRGVDRDNQFFPAIWIIPRNSGVENLQRHAPDCKTSMTQSLNICAIVNCAKGGKRHFDVSVEDDSCKIIGPYIEGAELLNKIHCCVVDFNNQNNSQPLVLASIEEPDFCNGHLVHCLEYRTKIFY